MRTGFFLAVVAWSALVAAPMPAACAETPTVDTEQSRRLTDFLKHNRLPLVRAQVLSSREGDRSVMLSGYTATDLGKSNAEKRTRLFLNDPYVAITNRIRVRPELLSMTPHQLPCLHPGRGSVNLATSELTKASSRRPRGSYTMSRSSNT